MGGFILGVPNSYMGETKKAFDRNLHAGDVQRYFLRNREKITTEFRENCSVEAYRTVGKHTSLHWRRLLKKAEGHTNNDHCRKLKDEASRLYNTQAQADDNTQSENLPVLIYYGTGRLWAGQKTQKSNQLKSANIAFGYYYALKPDAQNKTLMPWLEHADRIAYQERTESSGLAAVLDTIIKMIPGASNSYYSPNYSELVVEFEDKVFPYSDLSDGQRNIITLAGDLAMRCAHHMDCTNNPGQDADQWNRGVEDIVTEVMGVDNPRSDLCQKMMETA